MESTLVITNARLSFPTLWKPQEYESGDGKPRYTANLLLSKDDPQLKTLNKLFEDLFVEKFRDKAKIHIAAVRADSKASCIVDGDTKAYDGYEGMICIVAHRQAHAGAPKIINKDKSELRESDGKPYAGCYVNAKVSFWIQDNKNGKGFRSTLEVIQFARDGDAFSGAKPASADDMPDIPEDEVDALV